VTAPLPEIARRFFTAMGAGDTDAAMALVADDFELHLPAAPRGVPKQINGAAELAGLISNIDKTWSSVQVEIEWADSLAGDPDRGVLRAEVRATNQDGSTYRNTYLVLAETEGGLIRRWTEHYDPGPMVVAIDALRAHLKAAAAGGR
jgi:ketosteroid isomerase-like protein